MYNQMAGCWQGPWRYPLKTLSHFNFKDGEFSVEITNKKIRTQLGVCVWVWFNYLLVVDTLLSIRISFCLVIYSIISSILCFLSSARGYIIWEFDTLIYEEMRAKLL